MSRIRRLAPTTCPHCGAQNTLFVDAHRQLSCRLCGHRVGQKEEAPAPVVELPTPATALPPAELRRRYPVSYKLIYPNEVEPWAKSAYYTGLECVERGQYDEAIRALRRALEAQPDLIDAHLWLGRLLTDPEPKRQHYSAVLLSIPQPRGGDPRADGSQRGNQPRRIRTHSARRRESGHRRSARDGDGQDAGMPCVRR